MAIVLGLEPDLEVVGEAADGRAAVTAGERLRPDVVVLDLAMPEVDAIEALPHIRAASPATHVVVLTGFGSAHVRQRALDAGAACFIEKGTGVAEIVRQIRGVCDGAP